MVLGFQKGSRNQGKAEAIRLGVFWVGGGPPKKPPKSKVFGSDFRYLKGSLGKSCISWEAFPFFLHYDSGSRAASLRPFDFCFFHWLRLKSCVVTTIWLLLLPLRLTKFVVSFCCSQESSSLRQPGTIDAMPHQRKVCQAVGCIT